MSLSLSEFNRIPLSITPISADLHNSSCWNIDNRSNRTLAEYAKKILTNLSPGSKVFTKSTLSSWAIKKHGVIRTDIVTHQVHQRLWSGKIQVNTIPPQDYVEDCRKKGALKIESANFPLSLPLNQPGINIVQYFYETVSATSPYLQDVKSVEWRFQSLHLYDKNAIDFAFNMLTSKGFIVTIYPPYNTFIDADLCAIQAMGIRIPNFAYVPESPLLYEHPTPIEYFSVPNTMLLSNLSPYKYAQQPCYIIPTEWAINDISEKLKLIAGQDPLVKRCAFPLPSTYFEMHITMLEEFQSLGYEACLDSIYIHQECVGGSFYNFQSQNILIDLA